MRALELLYYLGALDTEFNLTHLGTVMAQLPLDPQVSGPAPHTPLYHIRSSNLTFSLIVREASDRESEVWV
jgi:pre-mRNA-splicing factor ATP-dependent RNA helicase DHX15/PRP43